MSKYLCLITFFALYVSVIVDTTPEYAFKTNFHTVSLGHKENFKRFAKLKKQLNFNDHSNLNRSVYKRSPSPEPQMHRGPPSNRGPPANRGPPSNRGPPNNKGPPHNRGPPNNRGPPDHRGPPDNRGPPGNRRPPGNNESPGYDRGPESNDYYYSKEPVQNAGNGYNINPPVNDNIYVMQPFTQVTTKKTISDRFTDGNPYSIPPDMMFQAVAVTPET